MSVEAVVHVCRTEVDAELLRERLDAEGIPARVRFVSPQGGFRGSEALWPAGYEVVVRETDVPKASQLIQDPLGRDHASRRSLRLNALLTLLLFAVPVLLWFVAGAVRLLWP
jgi:hypothetical protein